MMDDETREALEMTHEELHRRAQAGREVPVAREQPAYTAVVRRSTTLDVVIEHSFLREQTFNAADAKISVG